MRPDLAFTAMALRQHNANPTRAYLFAAKHVLCYISETRDFAFKYNFNHLLLDSPAQLLLPNYFEVVNANWAFDKSTCHSMSEYAFFLYFSLVL